MMKTLKKEQLHIKISSSVSAEFVLKYKEFANNVIDLYKNNQSLSVLSNKYTIKDLPQNLKDQAEELGRDIQTAPFLVDRIFAHDEVALKLYIHLFHATNPKITVTTWEIFSNDAWLPQYQALGADLNALAEINGELWLNSSFGVEYIDS